MISQQLTYLNVSQNISRAVRVRMELGFVQNLIASSLYLWPHVTGLLYYCDYSQPPTFLLQAA